QSDNRFRDTAVSPDGKTIYIATDPSGLAEAVAGGTTRTMENPGAILAFTYEGEGGAITITQAAPVTLPAASTPASASGAAAGVPPRFTAAQAAAGKAAYTSNCVVCHGNTL